MAATKTKASAKGAARTTTAAKPAKPATPATPATPALTVKRVVTTTTLAGPRASLTACAAPAPTTAVKPKPAGECRRVCGADGVSRKMCRDKAGEGSFRFAKAKTKQCA